MTVLSDADIAARIRAGQRCDLRWCREDRRPGGTLCGDHHDELGRILDPDYDGEPHLHRAASIPVLFAALDPTPTVRGLADRRAPGFVSEPPCNLHVITMRDPRSVAYPVVDVWYEPLLPGISSRIDPDRPHYEDTSPPRAVPKGIAGLAETVWDELGYHGPTIARDVAHWCGWLHQHLDHLTARDDAAEIWADLTGLHLQLRYAAGDPPPEPVATCTGWTRDPVTQEKVECGWPLYEPPPQPGRKIAPTEPVLRCERCDRPYTHLQMLKLMIVAEQEAAS